MISPKNRSCLVDVTLKMWKQEIYVTMTGEDAQLEACNREMTGSNLVLKRGSPKRF